MGSPKVSNAKPQLPMDSNKPTKNPLLSSFKNFFNKKKEKAKYEKELKIKQDKPKPNETKPRNENEEAVDNILKRFENLDLKLQKKEEAQKEQTKAKEDSQKTEEQQKRGQTEERKNSGDEFSNFKFKVIDDDRKRHSSEDSGYSDIKDDFAKEEYSKEDQEVIDSFDKLKIEDKDKKKKLRDVIISRTPIRTKVSDYNVDPYATRQVNHQVNKQALCGGQVFVASAPENYSEIDQAIEKLLQTTCTNQSEDWQDVLEVIGEDSQRSQSFLKDLTEKPEDLLQEFKEFVAKEHLSIDMVPNQVPILNPVEEFSTSHNLPDFETSIDFTEALLAPENAPSYTKMDSIFPTPPRSETVPSPMSESQASFYPPTYANWENSLSPERSSPIYHSDYERYQEISHEELSPVSENDEHRQRINSVSSLTRTNSLNSMTMKNFKDMQKDMSSEFSKKDCCQINKKTCKDIFDEHMSSMKAAERKQLCINVAKMELDSAYGVLQHIMLKVAAGGDRPEVSCALFALVCQRLLAQKPGFFLGDYGLSVLKAAVMRCPHRPVLTRLCVHFIYKALENESGAAAQECIFHEVDALGDNLIIACARAGDSHALVLAEITRADARGSAPPLFRVEHANTDGYTALHVACSLHGATSTRLHTLHVLLEHAQANLWKGDVKGGDTALHLAVNSANCDLRVIMIIFKQIDRKLWKKLAHHHNMSSVTPLEYARSATKSTTRQNYPHEVLDFLKKCR